jgi:TetR/AcrR family transcriptional regulator
MSGTRRQDTEQLRERIRSAAIQLFAAQGYLGTSLQEVADAVGISKQLLLYHYSSKDALRTSVMGAVAELWSDLLPLLLEAVMGDPDRTEGALDALLQSLDGHQDIARVVMLDLINNGASAAREADENVRPWMQVAVDQIQQRQEAGEFSSQLDPYAWLVGAATLLLSTISLLHLSSEAWPAGVAKPTWERRRLREAVRILQASVRP